MPLHHATAALGLGRRACVAFRRYTLTTPTSSLRSMSAAGIVTNRAQNAAYTETNRFISICANAVDYHLTHHRPNNSNHSQRTTAQCHPFSSASPSSASESHTDNNSVTTNLTVGNAESTNKSIFSKLWDNYSFEGQRKRILLGERLFRSAQYRANDP